MDAEVSGPAPSGPVQPPDEPGLVLRPGDYGAFRALEPGSLAVVLARPREDGLALERAGGNEVVAWCDVTAVDLLRTPAGSARVPTMRVRLDDGRSLDLADALSPGSASLPGSVEDGGPALLRVERFRLLCAAIVAAATLEPAELGAFRRAGRRIPVPDLSVRRRVLPPWAPPLLLLASVLVLIVFVDLSLASALAVTVVILAHEYGHVAAMRIAGMRVRGVVFLPFVGAATLPEHSFRSRWHEIWVHLAGPATGLPMVLLGLLAWKAGLVSENTGAVIVWAALLVNLINLFPLLPLDGGRVLLALTATMPRTLRTPALLAPLVGLFALLIFFGSDQPYAFLAALFLAFSLFVTRMALRRDAFHRWMEEVGLPLAGIRTALRDVTFAFSGLARDDVDGGVPPAPMEPWQVALALLAFTVSVVLLAGATYTVASLRLFPAGM